MSADDVAYFQSVGVADGKSIEEIRIEDYIKSYQTTGRPPQPVPPEPKDEAQRKALNLPPLFKPYVHSQTQGGGPSSVELGGGPKIAITDPSALPLGQEFRERVIQGERYHCMSALVAYEHFSHEELRCYAYARGHKNAPVPVLMVPFLLGAKQSLNPAAAAAAAAPQEDRHEHICAQPGYDKHSPEEFRIAFLLFGRELTSAQLMQIQNPTAATTAVAAPQPPPPQPQPQPTPPASTSAFSPMPSAIPLPIFSAATSQSAPKFTFGLR